MLCVALKELQQKKKPCSISKMLSTWRCCKPQLLGVGLVLAVTNANPVWSAAHPVVAAGSPPTVRVTVRKDSVLKVEEYRYNGQLRQIKVSPQGQPAYVLPDFNSDGRLDQRTEDFYQALSIPHWTLSNW